MSKFLAAELRQLIVENRQLEQRFQQLQRSIAAIRYDLESSGEPSGLIRPRRRAPLEKQSRTTLRR